MHLSFLAPHGRASFCAGEARLPSGARMTAIPSKAALLPRTPATTAVWRVGTVMEVAVTRQQSLLRLDPDALYDTLISPSNRRASAPTFYLHFVCLFYFPPAQCHQLRSAADASSYQAWEK